jgi:hypothetical protein
MCYGGAVGVEGGGKVTESGGALFMYISVTAVSRERDGRRRGFYVVGHRHVLGLISGLGCFHVCSE